MVGGPASLVLALGAHWELSLFGAGYARLATIPLVLLALGYLPCIPKVHYVAVCRATGKVNRAAIVLTSFAAAEVAMAAVGGYIHGLIGLSVGLLIVAVVEGVVTTPAIVKAATIRGGTKPAMHRRNELYPAAAMGADGRDVDYWAHKAQQEAGLSALQSLATRVKTDQPFGPPQAYQRLGYPGGREQPQNGAQEFRDIHPTLRSNASRSFGEDQAAKAADQHRDPGCPGPGADQASGPRPSIWA